MKIITAGVTSAMLAVGIAGSVAAYRTQVATPDARPVSQETAEDASPTTTPAKPKVRWAPCPAGSTLEKGACVTDVVRTVVLPAPSPAAQPTPTPQVAATPSPQGDDSDQSEDADGQGNDQGNDQGDDSGEADDHGDDQDDDSGEGDHEDDHEDED